MEINKIIYEGTTPVIYVNRYVLTYNEKEIEKLKRQVWEMGGKVYDYIFNRYMHCPKPDRKWFM